MSHEQLMEDHVQEKLGWLRKMGREIMGGIGKRVSALIPLPNTAESGKMIASATITSPSSCAPSCTSLQTVVEKRVKTAVAKELVEGCSAQMIGGCVSAARGLSPFTCRPGAEGRDEG